MGSDLVADVEFSLLEQFARIEAVSLHHTARVLEAFSRHRVSDAHFGGSTGYGYGDVGRDTLDSCFADVFGAEDALVRVQFVNGTHAIACALRACAPGGKVLSLVGKPYDTLLGLANFDVVPVTKKGEPDLQAAAEALKRGRCEAAFIQRSRGYSSRKALSVKEIGKLTAMAKETGLPVVVDNCYGEFVDELEPPAVGADLTAGSLIKNPGGGLALTGGYVAGTPEYVDKAAEALTVKGIGRECGSSLGQNRALFQGLFLAPHTVAQALKTACFCAAMLERLGFETSPPSREARHDIIQMICFGAPEPLLRFVRGIQKGSPVDSFATPEPWDMPGYDHKVVMAAGTFVQGASIELSCDGPMRAPYNAYLQGGLTYEAGKLGVLRALSEMGAL